MEEEEEGEGRLRDLRSNSEMKGETGKEMNCGEETPEKWVQSFHEIFPRNVTRFSRQWHSREKRK